MKARDFRARAREALRGKWGIAIIACLIASIFGAAGSSGFSINFDFSESDFDYMDPSFAQPLNQTMDESVAPILIGMGIFMIVYSIIVLIVGSVVSIGYSEFNVDLIDGFDLKIGTLFSHFKQTKSAIGASLLIFLRVFVGMIFFIVPGIIASYKYSMTYYIMAENPGITARDAMYRSKELMRYNKWRLFCLDLSFIGWNLLNLLTFGLASLWVLPYQNAARAAFYREIRSELECYSW